ncbi:DUF3679 domain-containing protein [Metabacillus sp. 113a]|uniref:DUF3679 domain-containing protein n=1 Tax=Metabacillus sp. 113a TaxID=3404706 RepID=UPI003CEFA4F5
MGKFMMKSIGAAALLFIGVLIGMQAAGSGMKSLQGYDDPDMKGAFTIKNSGGQEMEASILGHSLSSHDLEKKRLELEKADAFNPLSEAARGITSTVENLFQKLINAIKGGK